MGCTRQFMIYSLFIFSVPSLIIITSYYDPRHPALLLDHSTCYPCILPAEFPFTGGPHFLQAECGTDTPLVSTFCRQVFPPQCIIRPIISSCQLCLPYVCLAQSHNSALDSRVSIQASYHHLSDGARKGTLNCFLNNQNNAFLCRKDEICHLSIISNG